MVKKVNNKIKLLDSNSLSITAIKTPAPLYAGDFFIYDKEVFVIIKINRKIGTFLAFSFFDNSIIELNLSANRYSNFFLLDYYKIDYKYDQDKKNLPLTTVDLLTKGNIFLFTDRYYIVIERTAKKVKAMDITLDSLKNELISFEINQRNIDNLNLRRICKLNIIFKCEFISNHTSF